MKSLDHIYIIQNFKPTTWLSGYYGEGLSVKDNNANLNSDG